MLSRHNGAYGLCHLLQTVSRLAACCSLVLTPVVFAAVTESQLADAIVINEILADPVVGRDASGGFDTDGDGVPRTGDEFIELTNLSNVSVDISGYQFWDAGVGLWFTVPAGAQLAPGMSAVVVTGLARGEKLHEIDEGRLVFGAARRSGVFNNGGDNVVVLNPASKRFVQLTFGGDLEDDPTAQKGRYSKFPPNAKRNGPVEHWGRAPDGESLTRDFVHDQPGSTIIVRHSDVFANQASPTKRRPIMPSRAKAQSIANIQGAGHRSPQEGNVVSVWGIVTALDNIGFYLQDTNGDGDDRTSEGIFVRTTGKPAVGVGDSVNVTGRVREFRVENRTKDLTVTRLTQPRVKVLSTGNPLPAPVVLGVKNRPPTEVIDDDNLSSFDITTDAIDFYESIEGMRVMIPGAQAVSTRSRFREIFVVANGGKGASGMTAAGGIALVKRNALVDFNPERIQLDDDLAGASKNPAVNVGDALGDVTGVMNYLFSHYEVQLTSPVQHQPSAINVIPTSLLAAPDVLTIASYNVQNLDANDQDGNKDVANGRFASISRQIVNLLNTPDIIALQEVQDDSGKTNDGTVSARATLQLLADELNAHVGDGVYRFQDNPFIADTKNGGQRGGNIRVAYLYRSDRTELIEGTIRTVVDQSAQRTDRRSPFFRSRLPLAVDFAFNGQIVTVINNHFSSKGGSSPLFGKIQPSSNGGARSRTKQAKAVNQFVHDLIVARPDAKVVVLGDFNEHYFHPIVANLLAAQGGSKVLTNLWLQISENERYSYNFEGNSQTLDHMLVTAGLMKTLVGFDVVHANTVMANTTATRHVTDHDPLIAAFRITQ